MRWLHRAQPRHSTGEEDQTRFGDALAAHAVLHWRLAPVETESLDLQHLLES